MLMVIILENTLWTKSISVATVINMSWRWMDFKTVVLVGSDAAAQRLCEPTIKTVASAPMATTAMKALLLRQWDVRLCIEISCIPRSTILLNKDHVTYSMCAHWSSYVLLY